MKRLKLIGLLLTVVALTLSGCDAKNEDEDVSPYKVIDTGFWNANVNSLWEPLWLDNDRLMFASTENLKADGSLPIRLKILDTRTGEVISTPFYTAFCARNGIALFHIKDKLTGKGTDYRGTPENYHPEPQHSDNERFDPTFDCDWVPKATFGRLGFFQFPVKVKLRGDNYIEILEPGKPFYHADENAPGVSISNMSVQFLVWKHSEFLGAYVASGGYDPQDPNASSFAILHYNGELNIIAYPKTVFPGNNYIYPVKIGLLLHHSGDPTMTNHGNGGLYLIQGEKVKRLIFGTFGRVAVSPDGCKAAIGHAFTIREDLFMPISKRTIKFINLCQGDSSHDYQ